MPCEENITMLNNTTIQWRQTLRYGQSHMSGEKSTALMEKTTCQVRRTLH